MRRLLLTVFIAGLLLASCGGDDSGSDTADYALTTATTSDTTETTAATGDTNADEGFCADLETLTDIDPSVDPTQDQVDRVSAAAESAPDEFADALTAVAAFGQMAVEYATASSLPADFEAVQTAAVESATTLAAYATDQCGFDVPLFDNVAAA